MIKQVYVFLLLVFISGAVFSEEQIFSQKDNTVLVQSASSNDADIKDDDSKDSDIESRYKNVLRVGISELGGYGFYNPFRQFDAFPFELTYERVLISKLTAYLTGRVWYVDRDAEEDEYTNDFSYVIRGGVKWYLGEKPAPQGWYAGLLIEYVNQSIKRKDYTFNEEKRYGYKYEKSFINYGAILGYQWILQGFAIDIFAGLGVSTGLEVRRLTDSSRVWTSNKKQAREEEYDPRLEFPMGITIGWAF